MKERTKEHRPLKVVLLVHQIMWKSYVVKQQLVLEVEDNSMIVGN